MKRRKRFRKRHRKTEGAKLQKQRNGNYSGHSPNWLVGFAGIVQKKMWPARRSRTDKLWENNKKTQYQEKCNKLERHLKYHHNLLEQLNNLVHDGNSKECKQELTEMCTTNAKVLCYILQGDPLCNLPSNLQDLFEDAIKKDAFLKRELKREDVPLVNHRTVFDSAPGGRSPRRVLPFNPIKKTEPCFEQLPNTCDVERENKAAAKKKRASRKRGYQVFVRKFQETETVVVDNLKPSDKGERLITAFEDKIGKLPSACEFTCGSKKLQKNQTLEEQGIDRKSSITVRRLHDGDPNSKASGVQRKKPELESSTEPVNEIFPDVTRKKAPLNKVNKGQGMDIAFDGVPGTNQTCSSLEQSFNPPCDTKSNGAARKKRLPSKQVYQLFVHKFQDPGTVVVDNLSPSDKGELLVTALKDKIGQLPSGCQFMCGSKKLLKNQTLEEQGIGSESNITLTLNLLGGMNPNSETNGSDTTPVDVPSKWKKARVAKWVDEVCDEYEIDQEDVKELKLLNGAGLSCLPKEDWIRRSRQGDFMFMKWNELVQNLSGLKEQSRPSSLDMDTLHAKSKDVTELKGSTGRATDVKNESTVVPVEIAQNKSCEGEKIGPFGEKATFGDFEEVLSIDQIASQIPSMDKVITVAGLCSSRPNNRGGAGSVLLRNDPPTGSPQEFLQLKVDIRANPASNVLTKYIVGNVLDLQFGDDLVIRGRVETLDQGFKSKRKGYTILPFKVVVDSDYHAAARKKVEKVKPQLFTPWSKANLPFPAELDSHPLWQGDKLLKDKDVVWLPPETSPQKIKEFAVAARNCRTTDILVGVTPDGSLIGKTMLLAEVGKRREELCTAINSILPSCDRAIRYCEKASDAALMVADGMSSFVAVMWLQDRREDYSEVFEDESIKILIHVHVTKGDKPVYFAQQDDVHAYVRVGTRTKKLMDFDDLFSRLESLAWRNMSEINIQQEIDKASVLQKSTEKYELFKNLRFESDQREFKAIYGDPKDIILKDYVDKYTAAFLSTEGGDIYFGVEEDHSTKFGHVLGILLSSDERKELLRESAKIVCSFWPSVHSSQFFIGFVDIECQGGLTKHVLKHPKTSQKGQDQHILLFTGEQKAAEVQNLAKQIASKLTPGSGKLSLLRVKTSCYCLISEQPKMINTEQLLADLEKDRNFASKVKVQEMEKSELSKVLRDLCVVHLNVKKSPYPIHLCHPPRALCIDSNGVLQPMQPSELLARFKTSKAEFDIEKFLRSVDNFDRGFNSFVLMTSPFTILNEQDLYGLVIPEWLLVLDFDQRPHDSGHLFDVFQKQHDLHQAERNLFLKTPLDRKLDINPDNGTSWCAVRGYQELAHTLSEESHGEWNISHGKKVKTHLSDELIVQVNPNQLVVVCLCDEDHENLLPSMQLLLEHVFSIWSRTSIIFVCPNGRSETLMMNKLIEPLHQSYGNRIKKDNVFVVSPQHLARHLAVKLPAPYSPENAFQLPKKVRLYDCDRTIPETLPQDIRQAVHGHLQIMYLKSGKEASPEDLEKAREDFYSGSEITSVGLAHGIGIHRQKIKDLKRELTVMLNDKKSHFCMIVLKAERGSGASTLCLQFLHENHERFPCAKLIEFHERLVTNIEKIIQHTKLPLLLFVDSEMASLQDFTDFKNEAERRNIHMVLIVVESDVFYSTRNTTGKQGRGRKKGSKLTATPYSAGSSPYQIIELSRELEKIEIPHLVDQLRKISIPEGKGKQLKDLQKKAEAESSLRKFAYFSLTIFGKKYTGLTDYVSYRLMETTEIEAEILEFLSLTHVFTDHRFPVNALAGMLQTKVVILESVFTNNDVTELLSPPIQGKGERRISFGEVAEEILKQRATKKEMKFEDFLSDLALRIAQKVLAPREPSKMLERITRRLFVTSEYESKKFSSLVRTLKDYSKDVARDTMKGLVTIFQEGTSMWAHLLAHLAKFHMIEYGAFDEASTCIERALKEQPDDVLLHHIHGDIIRLHIQNLKEEEDPDVKEVLKHAIVSSSCFQKVREKRPLVEYGYTSDALVRRIVMQAVVKTLGAEALFTDYLTKFLEEMRSQNIRDPLHEEEKFILALIPDAFDNLRDVAASEHTDQLKKSILKEMGDLDAVKGFCEELKSQMKGSSDSGWIDEVVRRTTNLVNILKMETGNLTTEQIDEWMANLELHTKVRHDEHWMKLWIRYIRASSKVPSLVGVQKEIKAWMRTTKGSSLYANFYNYVVAVLIALKDPKDKEKIERACKAIEEMKRKRYVRKPGTASPVHSLPLEWLNPKEGRHINSIDSLLHHDDLVKEYLNCNSNTSSTQTRVGREIIERALFERDIQTFQGEVDVIEADWKGKICLNNYIQVHFIPSNVIPSMPSTGDTVKFALSFGLNGPQAWAVVCQPGMVKARKAENIRPVKELGIDHQSSDHESCDEEDVEIYTEGPLYRKIIPKYSTQRSKSEWEVHVGEQLQGIVSFTSTKGFGNIQKPTITETLFFHVSQMVPPVSSLKDLPDNTVVSFTVDKTESRGVRATNVQVIEDSADYLPEIRKHLRDVQDNLVAPANDHWGERDQAKVSKNPMQSVRQEGRVTRLLPNPSSASHGFIKVTATGEDVFFHHRESEIRASDMKRISVGTKVQFSIARNRSGDKYIAKNVYIQSELPRTSCSCGWEDRVRRGTQRGYISMLNEKGYGFISEDGSPGRGLYFHRSDVKSAGVRLCCGMYVQFKVDENDKSCIAKEISVLEAQAIPTPSRQVVELPHSFSLPGPFDNQR